MHIGVIRCDVVLWIFEVIQFVLKLGKVKRLNLVASGVVLTDICPGFDAHVLTAVKSAIEFQASAHAELSPKNDAVKISMITIVFIRCYRQFNGDFNDDCDA